MKGSFPVHGQLKSGFTGTADSCEAAFLQGYVHNLNDSSNSKHSRRLLFSVVVAANAFNQLPDIFRLHIVNGLTGFLPLLDIRNGKQLDSFGFKFFKKEG